MLFFILFSIEILLDQNNLGAKTTAQIDLFQRIAAEDSRHLDLAWNLPIYQFNTFEPTP